MQYSYRHFKIQFLCVCSIYLLPWDVFSSYCTTRATPTRLVASHDHLIVWNPLLHVSLLWQLLARISHFKLSPPPSRIYYSFVDNITLLLSIINDFGSKTWLHRRETPTTQIIDYLKPQSCTYFCIVIRTNLADLLFFIGSTGLHWGRCLLGSSISTDAIASPLHHPPTAYSTFN